MNDKKGPSERGKENMPANSMGMELTSKILPSNEVVFTKNSHEQEFHLMVAKEREQMYHSAVEENRELKGCLKMLQKELFDIVKLKSDIYSKRFKAENFNSNEE